MKRETKFLDLVKGDNIEGHEIIEIDRYLCKTSYEEDVETKTYIRHMLWVDDLHYFLVYHTNTISKLFLSFSKVNKIMRRKKPEKQS